MPSVGPCPLRMMFRSPYGLRKSARADTALYAYVSNIHIAAAPMELKNIQALDALL